MIPLNKLEKLTEEEYGILFHCMNSEITEERHFKPHELTWLRPKYAFLKMNEYAANTTEEKRKVLQSIIDKIE